MSLRLCPSAGPIAGTRSAPVAQCGGRSRCGSPGAAKHCSGTSSTAVKKSSMVHESLVARSSHRLHSAPVYALPSDAEGSCRHGSLSSLEAPIEALIPTVASPLPTSMHFGDVWRRVSSDGAAIVAREFWTMLCIYSAFDLVAFLLHRISHRLTNIVAVNVMHVDVPAQNLWYLAPADGSPVYRGVMLGVFALALPLTVMIKSTANAYVYALVTEPDAGGTPRGFAWNPLSSIKALPYRLSRAASLVARVWKRAAAVELVVSAISVPLQFASLAVVTLPLTLPLLLSLQCALPLAILEDSPGRQGRDGARDRAATRGHLPVPTPSGFFKFAWTCVASSHSLMKPLRWKLAVPFLAVVIFQRLVEMAQNKLLASMPARYYLHLVEIPLLVYVAGVVARIGLMRLQELFPLLAYREVTSVALASESGKQA